MNLYKKQLKEQLQNAVLQAVNDNFERYKYCEFVKKRRDEAQTICIYGAGKFYNDYSRSIGRYDYICDGNPQKWGKKYDGRLCISPQQLYEIESPVVFVMLGDYKDIVDELRGRHIESYFWGDLYLNVYDENYTSSWFQQNEQEMLDTVDIFEDDWSKQVYVNTICNRIAPQYSYMSFHDMEEKGEYFGTGIFSYENDECYVDAGAYDGDSIKSFIKQVNGNFQRIYGFEMDPDNYNELKKDPSIINDDRISVFQKGISCQAGNVGIFHNGTGSHIKECSEGNISLVSLDDFLGMERITMIKMDIEGAERDGLKGARKIIYRQHPKLAISIYHKLDDMWKIPQYIKQIYPGYKLALRHHTAVAWDTDCYAYTE